VVVFEREGERNKVQPDYIWHVGSDLYCELQAVGRLLSTFSSSLALTWDFWIHSPAGEGYNALLSCY